MTNETLTIIVGEIITVLAAHVVREHDYYTKSPSGYFCVKLGTRAFTPAHPLSQFAYKDADEPELWHFHFTPDDRHGDFQSFLDNLKPAFLEQLKPGLFRAKLEGW